LRSFFNFADVVVSEDLLSVIDHLINNRNACYFSSKVFKELWSRCHTPPTKELIEAYFKLSKNTNEVRLKSFKSLENGERSLLQSNKVGDKGKSC